MLQIEYFWKSTPPAIAVKKIQDMLIHGHDLVRTVDHGKFVLYYFNTPEASPKVEPKVVQPKRKKLKTKPKEDDDDL